MEPAETIMAIGMITDVLFRLGASNTGMTEEEIKDAVGKLQISADALEAWLKSK